MLVKYVEKERANESEILDLNQKLSERIGNGKRQRRLASKVKHFATFFE